METKRTGDDSVKSLQIDAVQLLKTLESRPIASNIEELLQGAKKPISRASARRRLHELAERNFVERLGKARATVYTITPEGRKAISQLAAPSYYHAQNQIFHEWENAPAIFREPEPSTEDKTILEEVRAKIRTPASSRKRVGYQASFLASYQPNETYYLPQSLRTKLRKLGQSEQMARLPAATYVREVFNRLLIDLSWNSSRLEGNTYSLLETERLLEMGREADPTRLLEARMILNHKEAIEFLVEAPDEIGFNRYTILNLHGLLARGLLKNSASEGRLRSLPVGIGGCAYLPLDVPQQIEQYFMEILEKADAIQDPLEQSFFAMVHLPYLQPFEDVNKRVSRLAANIPLIRENLSPISFVGVPVRDYTDATLAVYEFNRVELLRELYAAAYEESAARYAAVQHTLGTPDPLALHYHEELRQVVREVVQGLMGKAAAADHIRKWARDHVKTSERSRIVEMAETELICLHDGNIARFKLRPSEFAAWQTHWQKRM